MSRYGFLPDGWPAPSPVPWVGTGRGETYFALVADYSIPAGRRLRHPPDGCKPPQTAYPDLDGLMRALNASIVGKLPAVVLLKRCGKH